LEALFLEGLVVSSEASKEIHMTTESDDPLDRRDKASTKTLRLRSLSPALTVADVDASLVWYRDVVGFHVQEKLGA
jgi:hypothetical protein